MEGSKSFKALAYVRYYLVRDSTFPPFNGAPPPTQNAAPPPSQLSTAAPSFPGIHYDTSGRPWFRDPEGNWIGSSHFQPPQLAPLPLNSGNSAQSAAQTTYNFPSGHSRAPASTSAYPPLIDPALLPPPPEDCDDNLSDPATIARSRGLKTATKVAGVRQKDKRGKKRARSSDSSDTDSDAAPPPKRGRPKGSSNWAIQDVNKLLDLTEKVRPMGGKGWKKITKRHNKWARESNRPERELKSLEAKYKLLLKTKKPMGDVHCPPEIKRAHRIERAINDRAGTREVSDDDSDNDASSDSSIEVLNPPAPAVHTAVARRAPTPPRRNPRMNAPELVNKLAKAFDPEAQQIRDDERSQRSFQATQLFTLTQQLRDSQAANENLRDQLRVAERARDRTELKMMYDQDSFAPKHQRRSTYIIETYPDIVRVDGKIRNPSTADESEKENWDPSSSSSLGDSLFTRSSSPFDRYLASSPGPSQPPQQNDGSRQLNTALPSANLPVAGSSVTGTGPSNVPSND